MHCDGCGWECECEEDPEPFIGPMNAPTEGPPTLEQHLSNEIARAIFAPTDSPPIITGLAAAIDRGWNFGGC